MKKFTAVCAALFICVCLLMGASASAEKLTALDRYVAHPDTNHSYRLVNTLPGKGYTTFVLELKSQAWLTTNEVSHPVWQHWLTIIKPEVVTNTTGLLFISGGSIDRPAPKSPDGNLLRLALATGSVVAELRGVPNQPLTFAGETKGRSEDALIAYTWDKFLRTGDEKWPARLPMTKSAVRAMDTMTTFCNSHEGGAVKVNSFVVAGASKRGWTTWTTAIVDKRVVAIIPLVIDMLNIEPSFQHHFAAYGFWAPAVHDYADMKLMNWMDTKEHRALMEIEDPYEYRDRLTLPKFMIYASGDQFFLPDSSQFYFDQLPGPKYLRYVPNADHSLKNTDALQTVEACYSAVLTGAKLPQFSWTQEQDGAIRVIATDRPAAVKLWQAGNPMARDFRLETIGPTWASFPVEAQGDGIYLGRIATPTNGWTAFFVELTYFNGSAPPFIFTTGVRVLPDKLPFKFEKMGKPK
jgi:PhoPQ-activated pathogenicity-related protein